MAQDPKTNPDLIRYTCNVSKETNDKGEKVETVPLTITFDYTGVSRSALINGDIRNRIVRIQGIMRSSTTRKDKPLTWKAAVAEYNGKTVKVSEMNTSTRERATTPEQKAARIAKSADKQDRATLEATIKMLQDQLAGRK